MIRLVLVRHGETVWHGENRYAGRTDVALTERGVAQAAQLAEWARNAKLNAVWSSPLSRARLTASPAAEAASLPLQVNEQLMELDFGRAEGKTDAEMRLLFPEERAAFVRDPVLHHLPGGEDPVRAAERGVAALQAIAEASGEGGRALVVAHSTLLRLVLCSLLEIPLARYRDTFPSFANGTITEIAISGSNVGLLSFNVPLTEDTKRYGEHA
jgi:probable phosphoglycerate mutase